MSGPSGATVVRQYRGSEQAAAADYQEDAAKMARQGYAPTSQVWAPGQWGCGAFLVALILCIALIGILIFIYMLIVKPAGTLTVTYTLQAAPAAQMTRPIPATPPADLNSRLAQLDAALASGAITPEEHAARRESIIESV